MLAALVGLTLLGAMTVGGGPAEAAFPGQNGRIVCDGERGAALPGPPPRGPGPFPGNVRPRGEIYTMNPDGTDVRLLTNDATADIDPAFSPDGRRIVFSSTRSSSVPVLHTMNSDGTGVTRVLFTSGSSFSASWSPDGANIAFMDGSRGFNFEISRVRADGGDLRRLTTDPAIDGLPSWSPDGTRIAFDTTRAAGFPNFQVYTMSAEEGERRDLRPVTQPAPPLERNYSYNPHWSPDGTRLAFVSGREGNEEIHTVRADGSDVRRLTTNATDDPSTEAVDESLDGQPAWSPDGTKIVFNSARSGDMEVYTMNAADGSDVRRLTNNPGFDGRCDWQPIRGVPVLAANVCPTPRIGTEAADTINGTPGDDRIFGLGGNDVLNGVQGDDCLFGGEGNDSLQGSEHNDRLQGDAGNDNLKGGALHDRLSGGSGRDRVLGGAGRDRLYGGAGNDSLDGGRGRNRYSAGAGNDRVNAANGRRETVNCGSGRRDVVRADRSDRLRGCERRRVVR